MDRLDWAALTRPNVSFVGWARGWDAVVWHARVAALGAAALVLANVALSPDRLWSVGPLAAWAALLLAHAGVAAVAWRSGRAAPDRRLADGAPAPAAGLPGPVFAAASPTVERPRFRPGAPDVAAGGAHPGVVAPISAQRFEPLAPVGPAVAAAPFPGSAEAAHEDVLVVPAGGPGAAVAARTGPDSAAPAAAPWDERQDVAVSVVVLPEGAPRHPAAGGGRAVMPDGPRLPDHVVALWNRPPSGAAPPTGWGGAAVHPHDARPPLRGWPASGDGAAAP